MPRLMTYNVHGCVGVDGRLDVPRVAAVIAASRPDIVALQELDVCRARSGRVDQAHEIATRLGMRFHFNSAFNVAEEQYGDAILTHLPYQLVRTGPLPTLPRARLERRGALWISVELGEGIELQVVNTHLGLVPLEQQGQVAALLGPEWIGSAHWRGPGVLLGDFNANSRYRAYRMLAERMRDLQVAAGEETTLRRRVRTFPSRMPVMRIDHMFLTPGLEVSGVHAPGDPLARAASDHLPLVADLRVVA